VVVARGETRNIKENTQNIQHLTATIYLKVQPLLTWANRQKNEVWRTGKNKQKEEGGLGPATPRAVGPRASFPYPEI